MKRMRAVFMAGLLAAGGLAGNTAWADYGRGHFGPPAPRWEHRHYGPRLGIGAGLLVGSALLWAATRPPAVPVYVPPEPVVVMPPRPVVASVAPQGNNWWYYCRAAGAYYPYVAACPSGWEPVPAQPGGY